jgi:hypothetical protein
VLFCCKRFDIIWLTALNILDHAIQLYLSFGFEIVDRVPIGNDLELVNMKLLLK